MRPIQRDDSNPSSLDELLGNANVVTLDDAANFGADGGFDDLLRYIVAEDREPGATRRKRRSRKSIASIAIAATLLVGGATAAAAKWTSAHTGTYGHAGETENDTSEFLNLAGDGMPQLAAKIAKDIPFAPGDSAQAYIPGLVRGGGEMQVTGVKRYLTDDALCGWWGTWLQANREGNATHRARATAILQQAPTWPIVVSTDGGGVVTLYEQIATGARSGDPAVIQQAFTANCVGLPQRWAHK